MKKIGGSIGIVLLTLLLILAPMGTAKADNQKGPYVGIFGGYLIPDDLKLEAEGETLEFNLDNGFMIGAKAGYIIPDFQYVAVELEYNYMSKQDADLMDVNVGDVSLNNFFANLIFRYPHEMFRPYIGAGIGWSWIDWSASGIGATVGLTDEDDNAWAWQFLVGINFAFEKNWSADVGYRYFAAENFDVQGIDVEYTTSIITVGVNYHF
jgi:opacity protein-like surface antigen